MLAMGRNKRTNPTLWIDITELFGQFGTASHPTGISRVVTNLSDALVAERGALFGNVIPIFWHPIWRRPLAIDGDGLGALTEFFPALKAAYENSGITRPPMRSGLKKGILTSIPKPLQFQLFPHLNGVTHFLNWARDTGLRSSPVMFASGDCLFVPGSFWLDGYAPRLSALARAHGATVVGLVHDVLLLSHPEWLPPRHGLQFRRGVESFLPDCTAIVCNSSNTRDELRKYVDLPRQIPVTVCRLADCPSPQLAAPPPAFARLLGRRYVLFVSTLTPRKNHRFAVAAWQKLWSVQGDETPWLVFVGGGSPDAELARLLAEPASFGHRVVRVSGVDDAMLEALYANAWITLYPSLGEGYGLSVAKSLARGKICLASRCGGISEIAPDLVDAIDPADAGELVERIIFYLANPAALTAREKSVRIQYRPTQWGDTAREVRRVLEDAGSIPRRESLPRQ